MTRGWKIALGIAAAVVAVNLALRALQSVTGGTPGGPASSSYSTGSDGAAALAQLASRAGHHVLRVRTRPSATDLRANETAVVLDPPYVLRDDALFLRTFLSSGGRLVAGGGTGAWLRHVLDNEPGWSAVGVGRARPLAPVPEVAGVSRVDTLGDGSWDHAGDALPVLGNSRRSVAAVARVGAGRAVLLADSSPLQNGLLTRADDARFAVAALGPPRRTVVFFETYHGYGRASGLAAIPGRWWTLLAFLALAGVVLVLARGRRLGPPEAEERDLPPPRREYVESLGTVLARTRARDRDRALAPVRAEIRRRISRRAAIPADDDTRIAAAARRLGLTDVEVGALLGTATTEDEVLAAGRALARLGRRS